MRHARVLGAMHALNFSLCYLAGVYHFRREATEALRLRDRVAGVIARAGVRDVARRLPDGAWSA